MNIYSLRFLNKNCLDLHIRILTVKQTNLGIINVSRYLDFGL